MGYRQALVTRWSRRDRLAVLVVAVTVAFLTGVTLLGLAMAGQTISIAAEFGSPGTVESFDSVDAARAAAGPGDAVVPTTTLAAEGERLTVVGVPDPPPEVASRGRTYALPTGREGVLAAATQPGPAERVVEAPGGSREVRLVSRPAGDLIPDRWYVTTAGTVERLGPTGAFVLSPGGDAAGGASGFVPDGDAVPLLSALVFFVLGTQQLIDLLVVASLAGGVLVAVTAFSVTRVVVEDRRETIAVVRSTGATPATVYALFGVRALAVSAVGVALGYALGLVLVRTVVNAAVFAGAPTSLSVSVTAEAVRLLAPTSLFLTLLGGAAGVLAARPAVAAPPAAVTRPASAPGASEGRLAALRSWAGPTLLDWDALAPSTATLSVFVLFVLLVAASGAALAPLTSGDEQTITEADAPHPIASDVPASYAGTLQQQGVAASAELLLFEAVRGEPFLVRGVSYPAYASVSNPTMVRGRAPRGPDEAVVGADLAATLGVDVGDRLTLGGSTRPAFTRVEVVGVYSEAGIGDDQLLVSLETGARLSGKREGVVNFVRTEPLEASGATGPTLTVLDAGATTNETRTTVRLTLQNYGLSRVEERLAVRLGEDSRAVDVAVAPGTRRVVRVSFPPRPDGDYDLAVAGVTRTVRVGPADAEGVAVSAPGRIPTGAAPAVTVTDGDRPVANATVTVAEREGSWTTDGDGVARVPFPESGTYTVRAATGAGTATTTVTVDEGFERRLLADLRVEPASPSIATRPVAVATLKNPWREPVTRTVTLVQGDSVADSEPTVPPGGTTQQRLRMPFQPAGTYTVTLLQDGVNTTARSYEVAGDERLAAALASSGRRTSGGGLAQAVSVVFGNVRVLVAATVALVAVMTVGATTASFARSIHAARDEIGVRRAVGASPGRIYRLVLGDVLRVGGVSALLAVSLASALVWGLLAVGQLRLFGIVLRPTFSPALLLGAAGAALALALVSASAATLSLVAVSPARLLSPVDRRGPPRPGDARVDADRTEVGSDD